jgi:hypothetical protein
LEAIRVKTRIQIDTYRILNLMGEGSTAQNTTAQKNLEGQVLGKKNC